MNRYLLLGLMISGAALAADGNTVHCRIFDTPNHFVCGSVDLVLKANDAVSAVPANCKNVALVISQKDGSTAISLGYVDQPGTDDLTSTQRTDVMFTGEVPSQFQLTFASHQPYAGRPDKLANAALTAYCGRQQQ